MKIRKLLFVDHVDSAVEHDAATTNFDDNARAADVLTGT
jgi:hypothetical protein